MKKLLILSSFLILAAAILIPRGFASALIFNSSQYVYTAQAQYINQTSATLKGTVNPQNLSTKVWFEWGPSANGLIYATPPQSIGSRNANIDFLAGVGNLTANSVYYYRAVAQNSGGVFYGSTVSFKTSTYAGSGSSSSGGLFGSSNTTQASTKSPALLAIALSADKTKVDRGETFVLTARYQNIGAADADNVVLKVELPKEIELSMAAPYCYYLDKNSLVFNLGRVAAGTDREVNIQVQTSGSAEFGKKLEPVAAVTYIDTSNSSSKEVSDNLEISVVKKEQTTAPTAAVGFLSLSFNVWLIISVFLNAFLVVYILYLRKKTGPGGPKQIL